MSSLFEHHVESTATHVPGTEHSPEWATPQRLFDEWNEEFHFDTDVCASEGNAKCLFYFTRSQDGLQQDWSGRRCWMNPPYGRGEIDRWMAKAAESARSGALVVALVPVSASSRWWHEYAMQGEVRLLRGRIRFGGAKGMPAFSSALVVFRPRCSCCGQVLTEKEGEK